MSDHLGICFDINLETFFQGQYSDLPISEPRGLSSGHGPSVLSYIFNMSMSRLILINFGHE
jgi:hypothetical protein